MGDFGKVAVACLLLAGSLASGAAAQAPSLAQLRPVHLAKSNSPGLGQSSWQLLTFDKSAAYYFTSGRLSRNGDAAFGWFTEVFPTPQDFSSAGATGVQFQQSLIWATCSDNYYAIREFAWYDAQGRLFPQSAYMVSVPDFELPKPGSLQESVVKVLCGSFQGQGSLSGDGKFLLADYQQRLAHPGTAPTTVASNDTTKPTAIKARAPTAAGAVKPPAGLAKASWNVVNIDGDAVEYYTTKGITRTGTTAKGWITEVDSVPKKVGSDSITFVQTLVEANCAKKTTRAVQLATFDENQQMLSNSPVTNDPYATAEAGSMVDYEMKDLCGVKTDISGVDPVVGDGSALLEFTKVLVENRSASNSGTKPTAIKARAPQTVAGALKPPPGLGKASWYIVNLQGDMAEFYTTKGITRTGTTAKGWITDVHTVPQTMDSASVSFVQELIEANCTNKTTKLVQAATFDENRQMLKNIAMTNQSFAKTQAGSMIDYEMKDLCGIKTDLTGSKPIVGDGTDLLEFTTTLVKNRSQ